jgi:predicted transcriptional regulator
MALALDVYPYWRTTQELKREIECGEAVVRAIHALIKVGLLERRNKSVRPTEAAVHLERLELP